MEMSALDVKHDHCQGLFSSSENANKLQEIIAISRKKK